MKVALDRANVTLAACFGPSLPLTWNSLVMQDALAAFWAMRAQPGAPSDYLQPPLLAELLQQVRNVT